MSSSETRRVALCFMAHPDDCEFLAAGTLALLGQQGWELHIATATAGDGGSATLPPQEITAIRREEARTSASIIGAHYHCLEFPDIHIVFDQTSIRKTINLFREINPTIVITHSPSDYMVDHEVVSLLARSASNGFLVPNCGDGPVHAGAAIPHLYYADPIGLMNHDGEECIATTIIDISSVYKTKHRMLCCHASQREWLRAHYHVDEYTRMLDDWSSRRGQLIGVARAEGFRQHLGFGYPRENILQKHLCKDRS